MSSRCRIVLVLLLLLALATSSACGKGRSSHELVFADDAGRRLTRKDLIGVTGTVQWAIIGRDGVPEEAMRLHEQGRAAGAAGDHVRALALFEQARKLAPAWPYPAYDAAYTYLLQGDTARAEAGYTEVDRLAPRGFFTNKTTLDCLRRERAGTLPADFCRAFAMTEWLAPDERKSALRALTERAPDFGAAWHELSEALVDDEPARAHAIDQGLAASSDPESRGMLLVNKALLLQEKDRTTAIRMLGELAVDPSSTLGTEHVAKATLVLLLDP